MPTWKMVNKIELEIISDILSPEGVGKRRIITKNDKIKKLFDLESIKLEEYIEPRNGKHIKKYSTVFSDDVYFKVNKPYEELRDIILNRSTPIIGFLSKSKLYR